MRRGAGGQFAVDFFSDIHYKVAIDRVLLRCGGNTTESKEIFMIDTQVNSLARIRSRLSTLATAERQVADWLLQHSEEVIHSSMAQIAQHCNVSDTTVLRFCRAAGFKGYMDLKLSIARDLARPTQLIHQDISE
jgi:FixJ family two-component response regulator